MVETIEGAGVEPTVKMHPIADARKVIRDALDEQPGFKRGYVDNIAMLLYDDLGIDKGIRDSIANRILDLIFN